MQQTPAASAGSGQQPLFSDPSCPTKFLQSCIEKESLLIREHVHDARPYELRGIAYFKLGQFVSAKCDFEEALAIASNKMNPLAFRMLGECYAEHHEPLKAIYCLTEAIKYWPKPVQPTCYLRRAQSYATLKMYSEALSDADKLIAASKNQSWCYEFRARLNWNAGHYQKVVEDCSEASRLLPTGSASYSMRADAYDKLGQTRLAESDRQKVKELNKFLE